MAQAGKVYFTDVEFTDEQVAAQFSYPVEFKVTDSKGKILKIIVYDYRGNKSVFDNTAKADLVDGKVPLSQLPVYGSEDVDANYVHDQAQPASIWTINHFLNKKVSVTITDSAGTVVEGQVTINDGNKVVIEFNFPFSGEAILN